ncbi:hypothetical protein BPOR_1693g00010 [Botrytis porri]|uniref:Uncharacterized protein n=1 Tax=Botrytis porri TaxID=87229 RepID=A0A4Z1KI36_9HELO|nr:hypothetical protein BPOR_1693g00010 [Botrytis porri]
MNVDSRAIASVTDITGLPVLRDFGFESRNLLTLYILTSCYILTCKRPHKAEIMAERKLIIHDGQPEDFQLAKDITFVQLLNLVLEKKEDKLTYDHLWKVSDGFALVQDRISLITKPGEKLFNGRTITLLDHGLHDSCRRRLHYKLSSNVAICNQELSPPRKLVHQALEIDLEEREYDLDQREYSVEQGETANAEFEEITRTKITAGLKCRILDAESLEESIAIRNAALKEREERLDERKQLAVVDRKVLEVECAKAASRMDEIKIHKDMVKGAEALFQSREKAHEKIRDEFEARETLLGLNSPMMARELAVLEREQKVAASEAALKLERAMIQIRVRGTEDMKKLASESQAETKN